MLQLDDYEMQSLNKMPQWNVLLKQSTWQFTQANNGAAVIELPLRNAISVCHSHSHLDLQLDLRQDAYYMMFVFLIQMKPLYCVQVKGHSTSFF